MTFGKICDRCIPLLKKYNALTPSFKTSYSSSFVLKCLSSNPDIVPTVVPKEISAIIYAPGEEKVIHCGDVPIYILKGRHSGCTQGGMAELRNETHCLADEWIGACVSGSYSLIPAERQGKFATEP